MVKRVHNNLKFNAIFPVLILFMAGSSCAKDPIIMVDCTGVTPTYSVDIKPILNSSCAISGCHDSFSQQWGYDFSRYSTAKAISQGDRFLGSIQQKRGYYAMPLGGKLSTSSINLLTCWVQNDSPQ